MSREYATERDTMTSELPGHAGITEAEFAYLERLAAAAADSGLYGTGTAFAPSC